MRRFVPPAAALLLLTIFTSCGQSSPSEPQNVAPVVSWTNECAAHDCKFHDNSHDPDGVVSSRQWDFGDNGTSTEVTPMHQFAAAGNYTVKLTVTDNDGATASKTNTITVEDPVVTSLSCADGSAPGGYVSCNLTLTDPAGFEVKLVSTDCQAHGNVFEIVQPVRDTVFTDGCYTAAGTTYTSTTKWPAGTEISAQIVAPKLQNPPALHVSGSYPNWTLNFEDGGDSDFNDLVLTVTAVP